MSHLETLFPPHLPAEEQERISKFYKARGLEVPSQGERSGAGRRRLSEERAAAAAGSRPEVIGSFSLCRSVRLLSCARRHEEAEEGLRPPGGARHPRRAGCVHGAGVCRVRTNDARPLDEVRLSFRSWSI